MKQKDIEKAASERAFSFVYSDSGHIADLRTIAEKAFIAGAKYAKSKKKTLKTL